MAVHGGDGFDADVEEVGDVVTGDVFLHVAGLRFAAGGGDVGAAAELAHEDAVAVAVDLGDGVEDAVDAHADADEIAEVFDVDVAGAEFVGLVEEEVEDFVGGDAV